MSTPTDATAWPVLVSRLLGGHASARAVLGAAVDAAARMTGADAVEIVEWVRGRASSVHALGDPVLLQARLSPGPGQVAGRPVAVVPVDAYRDLIAARPRGHAPFSPGDFGDLQAVATLLTHGAAAGRKEAAETLHRLTLEIVGTLDMDRVLLTIANAAARLLASEVAGVFLIHGPTAEPEPAENSAPDTRELRMHCVVGHRTVETARLRIPAGRGIAGKVLASGRPERVDDYATTTAITKDYLGTAIQEGTQSGLCVPMRTDSSGLGRGEIIGVLAAWRRRPSVYSDEDEALLVSLAGLAAIGLANARLYQQQQAATAALDVSRRELERRLAVSDEALDIHRRLTEIAAEGLDLASLAQAVQGFVGGRVVIVPDGDRPAVQWPLATPGGELPRERDARPARETLRPPATRPGAGPGVWVSVSIEAANVRHGLLYAALPSAPNLRDVVTLEQSATICALLLGHEESLQAATARLRSEFVWDLLEGRPSHWGVADTDETGRALALGLRLAFPARIALLRAPGLRALGRVQGWTAEETERNRAWLSARIAGAFEELTGQVVPVAHRDEYLVAIVPAGSLDLADVTAAAMRRSPFPALPIEAGISREAPDAQALPQALHEARVALSAVNPSAGSVVTFDDLGVLQFLIAPSGAADLYRYAESVLGPLVEYDTRHGTDLVPTLDRYFEHGCNASRTARDLQLHAKSLTYRLRRITEIGGLDLDDRHTRLDVELALRILGPAREIHERVGTLPRTPGAPEGPAADRCGSFGRKGLGSGALGGDPQ